MIINIEITDKNNHQTFLFEGLEDLINWLDCRFTNPYSKNDLKKAICDESLTIIDKGSEREINRVALAEDLCRYMELQDELEMLNWKWHYTDGTPAKDAQIFIN